MLPLQGMTVVAVEQAVAAPFASRQLADLGARVIKIERPGAGDFARGYDSTVNGLSSHFVWLNRSKESLTLDLKHPEAAGVLRQLISRADVFLHNLAPGAMGRLGFGSAALRKTHSRLVVCEISGYGTTGPYRDKKAYDLLVQSEAGLVSITGTPDTPSKVGISVADISAGMYAFSGILAALLRRERTGEGATLDVSLFDSLAEWMGFPAYYTGYGGAPPPRSGARNAVIAPYGPYTAGDGKVVYLGLQNEREWARFCEERARAARPGHRSAVQLEFEARGGARRDGRGDHRGVFDAHGSRGDRTAGVGGDRQRADEHCSGVPDASAARGARPLAFGRVACRPDPRHRAAVQHRRARDPDGTDSFGRRAYRGDPG